MTSTNQPGQLMQVVVKTTADRAQGKRSPNKLKYMSCLFCEIMLTYARVALR